jgi:hypothetical protein
MSYANYYANTYSNSLPVDTSFYNYTATEPIKSNHRKKPTVDTWYQFWGHFFAFIFFGLSLGVLIASIVSFAENPPCSQYVTATIANTCGGALSCCTSDNASPKNYTCNLQVNYTVNGVDYTNIPLVIHGSSSYQPGQNINICYSSDDAKQISFRPDNTSSGVATIVLGSILFLLFGSIELAVWIRPETAETIGREIMR